MYFPYGWPKLFNSDYGAGSSDSFMHLAAEGQYLFAVSSSAIQIWTAGLHRVRLGEIIRSQEECEVEGPSIDAFWSTQKSMLAVLTAGNYLLIYSVHTIKDPLLPGSLSAAASIPHAELNLRSTTYMNLGARATCLTGDSRHLLIGTDDGSLGNVSWHGKLREDVTYPIPLDAESDADGGGGGANGGGSSVGGAPSVPIVQLDYCELTCMLAVVMADGSCALCGAASGAVVALHEIAFARWVCLPGRHARCARIGAQAQMVAVGCANGEVALYRLHGTAAASTLEAAPLSGDAPIRVLSLGAWGHTVAETGGVTQVAWSPDCRAVAVSFLQPGLVVWSPSGCRLMCSLRQVPGSLARRDSGMPGGTGLRAALDEPGTPLEAGLSAMAWGPHGYQLLLTEVSNTSQIVELQFARALSNHHRVAHAGTSVVVPGQPVGEEVHVLQAHDRLIIISEAVAVEDGGEEDSILDAPGRGSDLVASHVLLPYQYICSNWPMTHAAVSDTGMDVAVAGTRGVALYNRAAEKWRLFGDISQERQIRCRALCWLDGIIMICSGGPDLQTGGTRFDSAAASAYELLLFPKYHLDFTSLLCRHTLAQPPLSIDCVGNYILVASEPLEITLMEVIVTGQLTPSGNPRATLQPVREISMLSVGRPLLNVALVQPAPPPSTDPTRNGGAGAADEGPSSSSSASAGGSMTVVPRQVVLLRWGGLMSVLDLEKGAEVALSTEVECFWLGDSLPHQPAQASGSGLFGAAAASSPAPGRPGANGSSGGAFPEGRSGVTDNSAEASTSGGFSDKMEMPWWAYSPAGMQLLFPSSLGSPLSSLAGGGRADNGDPDVELEFDQEVYPIGISLADASIVGITQRIVRGLGLSAMLPGLSYHQSGTGQFPGFYPIPESQPVLPCLLRRLLQKGAVYEALSLARRHERGPHFTRSLEWLLFTTLEMETSKPSSKRAAASPLLSAAADLARQFPQFADVVVSVARKTDAQLWPPLFSAVGSPSALLEGLLEAGALTSAACFLLVIDRLEGASVAHTQALRLIGYSLQRGQYGLCGELLRFIIPGEVDAAATAAGAAELVEDAASASTSAQAAAAAAAAAPGAAVPAPAPPAGPPPASSTAQSVAAPPPAPAPRTSPTPAAPSTWIGWLTGYPAPPVRAPLAGSAIAMVRSTSQQNQQQLQLQQQQAAALPVPEPANSAAAPAVLPHPTSKPTRLPRGSSFSVSEGPTPALDARCLVAQHAWYLVEEGCLAALASLIVAVSQSLGEGLASLMQHNRAMSAYAQQDHLRPSAQQLLTAMAAAVQELPVWNGGEVEHEAADVLSLCRALGLVAYSAALSVLLVDAEGVAVFRLSDAAAWDEFVELLRADPRGFGYLFETVDALSGGRGAVVDVGGLQQAMSDGLGLALTAGAGGAISIGGPPGLAALLPPRH